MIAYDSHRWKHFLRYKGSVLPTASLYAIFPTVAAFVLKLLDKQFDNQLSDWELLKTNQAWTVFTGTLGFLLVFRTGQCYSRFTQCASSVFTMKAQMYEAYSSLISFCCMCTKRKEEIYDFKDKLLHLFSLLHACALASVTHSSHNTFTVLDIDNVPTKYIHALQGLDPERRVELTYQWINNLVIMEIPSGLLNVPPPILSRIFQEMEKAMVEHNNIVQLMTIPFPFPYSQACVILMIIHLISFPMVVITWTEQPLAASLITFVSCVCFLSLELISAELENPFGDDVNDLPITHIHDEFNEGLQLLLHPSMEDKFVMNRHKLSSVTVERNTWKRLDQVFKDAESVARHDSIPEDEYAADSIAVAEALCGVDTEAATGEITPTDISLQNQPPPGQAASSGPAPPKQSPSKPAAPKEMAWFSEFTQRQREYEEDLIRRLDAIVHALTIPAFQAGDEVITGGGGASRSRLPFNAPLANASSVRRENSGSTQTGRREALWSLPAGQAVAQVQEVSEMPNAGTGRTSASAEWCCT